MQNGLISLNLSKKLLLISTSAVASLIFIFKWFSKKKVEKTSKAKKRRKIFTKMNHFFGGLIGSQIVESIKLVNDIVIEGSINGIKQTDKFVKFAKFNKNMVEKSLKSDNNNFAFNPRAKSEYIFFQIMKNMESRFKTKLTAK